jgi:ATP-dependent Clp protease ATP-binding subunit ClpC
VDGFNFTERTRVALAMAREEAGRLRHEYVGTEHILLGLIREGGGVAMAVLRNLGIDPQEIVRHLETCIRPGRPGSTPGPDLPYTSRAKRVLEEAMAEAREIRHSYVGSEHLLLGLLRENNGIAAQVLFDAGLTLAAARAETLRLLGSEIPPAAPPSLDHEPRVLADSGSRALERVDLMVYYRDGNRLHGSFASAREAASFLQRLDPPQER